MKRRRAGVRSKRKPRARKATARAAPKRTTAKRAASKRAASKRATVKRAMAKRATVKRATVKRAMAKRAAAKRAVPERTTARASTPPTPELARALATRKGPKVARLDRERRTLDDTSPSIPSSLNLDRHGSATRTGRFEMAERLEDHATLTPAITGGDIDADIENAYFSGDEAPGGDNPTPDQDVVDDIGRAVGIEYQDAEELKAVDKITERDRKRWELDPASSEDYPERK